MSSRFVPHLKDALDWRAFAVFHRNRSVYFRNWRTQFFPPALEPIIFFLAFGLGLGSYVGYMLYEGTEISYGTFVAPGMLAYTCFTTPYFEGLYASYVRMFYQKTWDGILATQVELRHIVWGEALWCGVRGAINATIVSVVLAVLTAAGVVDLHLEWLPIAPLLGGFAGVAFGMFALIFTAIVPSIDHMNYPSFVIGIPLSLISNTYFPVESSNPVLNALIHINPLYHLAEGVRNLLVFGQPTMHLVWLAVSVLVFLVVCATIAQGLTARRVLGD